MLRVDLGSGDVGVDESFDRYARIVRRALDVPVALVSLVERDRQVFVGAVGLEPAYQEARQTPLTHSFCQWVVHDHRSVVTSDSSLDERLRDNLAIPDLGVVAYAGHPLRDHTGTPVATFCVFDRRPRELTPEQREALEDLAAWAERELVASTEMQQASRVQASLLPSRPIRVGEWDVDGLCLPAMAVGGDFYDYEVTGGVLHVSLGDVMGKGTGAALIGAATRTALRGTAHAVAAGVDLGITITQVAHSMLDDLERAESFVTLIDLALDLETGVARFVDAGSGLVLLVRADGTPHRLSGRDRPLGVLPDDWWEQVEVTVEPGDRLILFSDGVLDLLPAPEAWPPAVGGWVAEAPDIPTLLTNAVRHVTDVSALDDITMVAIFRQVPEVLD